jgi:CheY-like chemotaxis protein
MADKPIGSLERDVRQALHHLYDPPMLRHSPLLERLGLAPTGDRPSALRRILLDAIQTLKPDAATPPETTSWRIYRVLTYRFVEQSKQTEVAADLALSIRQLRRLEASAARAVADVLRARFELEPAANHRSPATLPDANAAPGPEQELDWLRKSSVSEVTDIREALEAALKTIDPLLAAHAATIQVEMQADLPPVAGQPVTLRQALLAVMTAAIQLGRAGRLRLSAKAVAESICVEMTSTATRRDAAQRLSAEIADNLTLARQLLGLSEGRLEIAPSQPGVLRVKMTFPAASRIPILVIDDNADTLRLIERYLAGSRFAFTGASHPEQALALADQLAPRVILLDVMFPEVDGWEILGRLRAHPHIQHIPVIINTILPQESLALALGAAAFLRKPVNREALLKALEEQVTPAAQKSG